MCEACESDEPFEPRQPVPPAIIAKARAIEAALAGEPAPDAAWAIYLGQAGGAITFAQYQRIRSSTEAAFASAPRARMASTRRPAGIRCEAVG
jgi:hypothetical protein